jgi:hypothetical protein
MRQIIFISIIFFGISGLSAQPYFGAGVKAGVNTSDVVMNLDDFSSESILRTHIGAFARLGVGRVYIQPEAYFISKGGEVFHESGEHALATFDFNNVDVPVLLGVKVLEGEQANLRLMTGPVFSFLTSTKISGNVLLSSDYYKDKYFGYQYGIGVDLWNFFIDARLEYGSNRFYYEPEMDLEGRNRTFMITVGMHIF